MPWPHLLFVDHGPVLGGQAVRAGTPDEREPSVGERDADHGANGAGFRDLSGPVAELPATEGCPGAMRLLKVVTSRDGGGVFSCETRHIQILRRLGHTVGLAILREGDKLAGYQRLGNPTVVLPEFRSQYSGSVCRISKSMHRSVSARPAAPTRGELLSPSTESEGTLEDRREYLGPMGVASEV